jgi:ankyrin repeat protein
VMVPEATIIEAIMAGDLSRLQLWGRMGVSVGSVEPLRRAALLRSVAVVKCLINELGADVSQRDHEGATPLNYAAQNGFLPVVKCLVEEFGADVNSKDIMGSTALMAASYGKHDKVIPVVTPHALSVYLTPAIVTCLLPRSSDISSSTAPTPRPLLPCSALQLMSRNGLMPPPR